MKKAKNDIDSPFNYGSGNISFQKYSLFSSAAIRSACLPQRQRPVYYELKFINFISCVKNFNPF